VLRVFDCIFRSKVAIDSDRNWPLIPVESGHRFRLMLATFYLSPESGDCEAALDNSGGMGHHVSSERRRRGWRKRGYPCVRFKRFCG
jgi:hypothetical protein